MGFNRSLADDPADGFPNGLGAVAVAHVLFRKGVELRRGQPGDGFGEHFPPEAEVGEGGELTDELVVGAGPQDDLEVLGSQARVASCRASGEGADRLLDFLCVGFPGGCRGDGAGSLWARCGGQVLGPGLVCKRGKVTFLFLCL